MAIFLAGCSGLASGIRVDLRPNSTEGNPASSMAPPLTRNQGGRNTCQTFAAIAAVEAAYKRQFGIDVDLSEEFTNYTGKVFWLSYNLYTAPLPAEASETQMGAFGGGGGTGWLNNLSHGFAVPREEAMPYSAGYSLVPYCGEGCAWGTDEFRDFAGLQRNVGDFNLNQANLPLSALTADEYYSVRSYETINARDPAEFERVLDQGYEIVWDFDVRGYRGWNDGDYIWRPQIVTEEATLTRDDEEDEDALPKSVVFDVLEVKQGDTVYEEGTDWEQAGNKIRWLGDDAPEDGEEYTVKYQHENPGGSHVMLIVGYNPALRYFMVKNSWDTGGTADLDNDGNRDGWTLVSYNYVRRYGLVASYITAVNPPRAWPELAFVGRWNLSFDGYHGVLDIYHIPGIMQHWLSAADVALTDRRIGTFYDSNGDAFRVNGSISGHKITFYIDMENPDMPIDQLTGRRFDYYYFREDVDSMAGFHTDPDGSVWGGYALRCPPGSWPMCGSDWLESEFDSPRPLTPESWVGRWNVTYDGFEAEMIISRRDDSLLDGASGYAGLAAELTQGGSTRNIAVRVRLDDPAVIDFPIPDPVVRGRTVIAEAKHLSWESGVAAGSYEGARDQSFGLHMVRSSSLLVVEIVSPEEGSLSRAQQHLFDSMVLHDPGVECCTYEWTSSLEGFLSDQESFSRWGSEFESGTHTIRLTVQDSEGNTAEDEIEVVLPVNLAPTVEILSPPDESTFFESATIALTGRSIDTDHPPTYTLDPGQVSWYLGNSASPFATGHTATLSGLSPGSYRVTFTGSDGEFEASDEIRIFVVADPEDLPPTATILSPSHGQTFNANAQDEDGDWYVNVTLSGQGQDPEDGTLSGGSLVWTDSVNGGTAQNIGTGASLPVRLYAPQCFGNTHTIRLTVTDSAGNPNSASITVTVSLLC